MKSQTLGLVLGLNVAVACLVLQGCKANKPGSVKPAQDTVVVVEDNNVAETVEKPSDQNKDNASSITVTEEAKPATVKVEKVPATPQEPPKKVTVVDKAPSAPSETTLYTVRSGDTLSAIATRYNIKMSAILSVNPGLNPNRIFVGKKIKLPGKVAIEKAPVKKVSKVSSSPATAAKTTAPATTKKSFTAYKGATKDYTVKSGDILGKIAYENGISIRALKQLNSLKSNNIRVGQVLKVPAEKIVKKAPETKNAKKVDVANEKAVEPKAEVKAPEVKPAAEEKPQAESATTVTTSEAVAPAPVPEKTEETLPAVEATPAPASTPAAVTTAPATEAAPEVSTYVVKEGQDILSIAVDFGISPAQLLDVNNLKMTDTIKPGDVLKLPAGVKQPSAQ
jgi:LysM repeat protein